MSERGDRLAALVAERELDCLLVTDPVNVRYLTGFGGTNGACVCGGESRVFLTDFRYTERAEAEVEGWEVVTVKDDWLGGSRSASVEGPATRTTRCRCGRWGSWRRSSPTG